MWSICSEMYWYGRGEGEIDNVDAGGGVAGYGGW